MAEPSAKNLAGTAFSAGDGSKVKVTKCKIEVNAGDTTYRTAEERQYRRYELEPKKTGDKIQLSDTISYFFNEYISRRGRVFKGEQTTAAGPRKIAVKLEMYDEKTLRECQVLLKLGAHQNVVSYIASNIYHLGDHMFLAMELCSPQNLRQFIEERKKLNVSFDESLAIKHAKQIVAGLQHIHSCKIIHRDLKPDNILFSLDQKNLKISDFGFSKDLLEGSSIQSHKRIGTDGYRAPETFSAEKVSEKADMFSLGLVLFYIWSYGEHPYGEDPDMWNSSIKKAIGPDFDGFKLTKKRLARNLVGWMLSMEPDSRPSIDEVEDDEILGGQKKAPSYLPLQRIKSRRNKLHQSFGKLQYKPNHSSAPAIPMKVYLSAEVSTSPESPSPETEFSAFTSNENLRDKKRRNTKCCKCVLM